MPWVRTEAKEEERAEGRVDEGSQRGRNGRVGKRRVGEGVKGSKGRVETHIGGISDWGHDGEASTLRNYRGVFRNSYLKLRYRAF